MVESKGSLNYIVFLFLAGLLLFSHKMLSNSYTLPYPHFDNLIVKQNPLQDVAGILFGARNAAADIAWVQFLNYCGAGGACGHHHGHENEVECVKDPNNPEKIKYLATRIVRINPYFYESYLFSSAILAWYVNSPDEAINLLKEGIRNNPKYWQFRLYIGAIAYKKSEEFGKMIIYLEEAVKYPDCPLIIKSVLANSYKKQKQYLKAIEVWQDVLDLGETAYKGMAQEQIKQIKNLVNNGQR